MVHPFPLFESIWTPSREVAVTPEVMAALTAGGCSHRCFGRQGFCGRSLRHDRLSERDRPSQAPAC